MGKEWINATNQVYMSKTDMELKWNKMVNGGKSNCWIEWTNGRDNQRKKTVAYQK